MMEFKITEGSSKMDLNTFMQRNIVILDTCVCRALINPEESPWFDSFCTMKNEDVEFCISDVASVELIKQFNEGGIKANDWATMIDKLDSFISDFFPILPGGHQLFQMASIVDSECLNDDFNFAWEYTYSKAGFDVLRRCKDVSDLSKKGFLIKNPDGALQKCTIKVDEIDSILQKERQIWIDYATKNVDGLQEFYRNASSNNSNLSSFNTKNLEKLIQEEFAESLFDDMKSEIKKNVLCEPCITIRAELLLKYLATIVARSAKNKEPYNPKSAKRKNDGIDFLFLLGLVLPARICSKDSLKIVKGLESFQSAWILTPDELAEQWSTGNLTKLSWPDRSND